MYYPLTSFKEDILNGKFLKAVSILLNVIIELHISTTCLHSSKVVRFGYRNDTVGQRLRVESDSAKRFGYDKYIN